MPEKETKILLASNSSHRAELLSTIGVNFELVPSHVDERPHPDEAPPDYIIRLARAKVVEVARRQESGLVIGADTIVVLDSHVLGKPQSAREAEQMLKQISGRWHAVMTGVALYDVATKREVADYEKTLVRVAQLTDKEIDWYINSGEPVTHAGAYSIQDRGAILIEEIAGNYHNVVGLPLPLVYRLAKRLGYSFVP